MPRGFAAVMKQYAVPMMADGATRCCGKIILPSETNAALASLELRALGAVTTYYQCDHGAHFHLITDLDAEAPTSIEHRKRKFAVRGRRKWQKRSRKESDDNS